MSESLPDDETKLPGNVNLEDILKTADDSIVVYFVEVDSK